MSVAYELEGAGLLWGAQALMQDLNLTLADRRVTAIVGPSGMGKSTLLHTLAGEALPGLVLEGRWTLFGRAPEAWNREEIALLPQRRGQSERERLQSVMERAARVLLLDEPLAQAAEADLVERYATLLQRQRAQGPAVLVSHNLELVRKLADEVVLLCAGRLECCVDTETFFARPPTPLASQFVRQGNCWPRAALPRHFHWVQPSLAGMGRPGLMNDIEQDLAALGAEGVDVLVSLTQRRIPQEVLTPHGIAGRHLPIPDMGVPSLNAAATLCRDVQRALENGSRVAYHCDAGLGRTGTLLASQLVWGGANADAAIEHVRTCIRGAIQTDSQLSFIHRFAEAYAR